MVRSLKSMDHNLTTVSVEGKNPVITYHVNAKYLDTNNQSLEGMSQTMHTGV